MEDGDIKQEAILFGKYYLKVTPNDRVISLYSNAINGSIDPISSISKDIIFVHRHPWSLRFVDSGAAIVKPQSEIRKRLYTMFAILEASSEYYDLFLPKKRNAIYIVIIGLTACAAVVRALVGIFIVKALIR